MVLDSNGLYINTSQTNIRNACLSVILEFFLYVVVCSATTAFISLYRSLKYLLARFLIFDYVFFWLVGNPDISSPNFNRICVLSINIFLYLDMPDVTASYGTSLNSVAQPVNIHYTTLVLELDKRLMDIEIVFLK